MSQVEADGAKLVDPTLDNLPLSTRTLLEQHSFARALKPLELIMSYTCELPICSGEKYLSPAKSARSMEPESP